MLAYHDDYYRFAEPAANVAPSAVPVGHGHDPTPNLTFTRSFSEKTVLEAHYSGFYGQDNVDPFLGGPPQAPRFYDFDTGEVSGGTRHTHDGEIWRTSLSGKLSHFADDFLKTRHDFKFGVQYFQGGWESVERYNDFVYTYTSYGARYGYGSTRLPFHYGAEMPIDRLLRGRLRAPGLPPEPVRRPSLRPQPRPLLRAVSHPGAGQR